MKQKNFTVSDTVPVKIGCGFQPSLIYFGTGGTFVFTTQAGDTVTTSVYDGQWYPSSNIVLVKSTGSAGLTGLVGQTNS